NTVQADGFALVEQIFVHAGRSDNTTTVFVDLPNTPHQPRILLSAGAWLAVLPGVIPTGSDLQATAHQSYLVLVAAALDHRVPLDDSLAKYAAASLKKSRSLVTRANSRLRRASSSSRGLPVPGKAFSVLGCASRTQRVSRLGATPISRATCRQLAPERRTSSMA